MSIYRYAAIPALLLTIASQVSLAQKKQSDSKPPEEALSKIVERNLARWDRDHNNILDLIEIDHVIEDHNVHGRQAAMAVSLRRHVTNDKNKDHPTLSHDQLMKLVNESDFIKSVNQLAAHLETIDRELFLPKDPELTTFSQGKLNDCYLLAAVAAQVHRSPRAIREMIHPEVTGGFQITFGDGQKIEVSPLTEGELLLGARLDNRHGSWLIVIEKAYGIIRKRDRAKKGEKPNEKTGIQPFDALNWGNSAVTIALLTGHHAESMKLGKLSHADQVHNLLTEMTRKRRLLCAGKSKDQCPPGIVGNHVYAIIGYDSQQKIVTIFNPWGNNFTPKGPSGKEHGYSTKNGQFTVPLDQFHSVFADVIYETDKSLSK